MRHPFARHDSAQPFIRASRAYFESDVRITSQGSLSAFNASIMAVNSILLLVVSLSPPDITFSTDVIVGFPGETEEDFLDTLDVVRQVRFDSAYTFIYSKRTGTPAAEMDNQIPEDVTKERFNRLIAEIQNISDDNTKKLEGQVVDVLVEEINEQDDSLMTGRLSNNLLVHFKGGHDLLGKLLKVKLVNCKGFYFMGELVS